MIGYVLFNRYCSKVAKLHQNKLGCLTFILLLIVVGETDLTLKCLFISVTLEAGQIGFESALDRRKLYLLFFPFILQANNSQNENRRSAAILIVFVTEKLLSKCAATGIDKWSLQGREAIQWVSCFLCCPLLEFEGNRFVDTDNYD